MRRFRPAPLLVALAVLGGCASVDIPVAPDPATFAPGIDAPPKIPVIVAYVIPDSYRSSVVRTPNGSVGYHPYRDLEPAWRAMLASVFTGVVRLDANYPPEAVTGGRIRYVLSPELVTSRAPVGAGYTPQSVFTVELTVSIRCANGALAARPQVAAQSQTGVLEVALDEGAAGRRALEDALRQMQKVLMDAQPDCA